MVALISIPIYGAAFLLLALAWQCKKNCLRYFALRNNNPHFSHYYQALVEYWAVQVTKALCACVFFFLLAVFVSVTGAL